MERPKAQGDRIRDCARRIVCSGDQITRNGQANFISIWFASFAQTWLPFCREPCESFSADAHSFSFAVQLWPLSECSASQRFVVFELSQFHGNRICPVGSSPRRETSLHLSGDAFVCSLLSSRQPNAIVESAAAPRASRVSTMPALMRTDDSRA